MLLRKINTFCVWLCLIWNWGLFIVFMRMIHKYVHTHTHTHTQHRTVEWCKELKLQIYTEVKSVCVCVCTHTHTHIYVYIYMYVYIYIYIYIYIYNFWHWASHKRAGHLTVYWVTRELAIWHVMSFSQDSWPFDTIESLTRELAIWHYWVTHKRNSYLTLYLVSPKRAGHFTLLSHSQEK